MSTGFLLDTNVLSELMRDTVDSGVLDWFAKNTQSTLRTSTVTQAEILTGIALLPSGKRRTALAMAAEAMFEQEFDGSCLVFDTAAAKNYALIVAARTRLGLPISTEDAQIAAITLANALTLVTRNTKDFQSIDGLTQVNPWVSKASH
jgi:predicted nucleic acid-binding protein